MKPLYKHTLEDWKHLRPFTQGYKTIGFNYMYARYLARKAPDLDAFFAHWPDLNTRAMAVTIAFNQPEIITWLIRFAKRNLVDANLVVADNSSDDNAAAAIGRLCAEEDVPYLRLPPNPTRVVMRSHGLAIGWVYHHLVKRIEPPIFAFLDHDMAPMTPFSFAEQLQGQPFYGLYLDHADFDLAPDNINGWFLWAGYCIYDYGKVANRTLDFRPDWFIGLDTGGANWWRLYRYFEKSALRFAAKKNVEIADPAGAPPDTMEAFDGWLHLGNAALYDNQGTDRRGFYCRVMEREWAKLSQGS